MGSIALSRSNLNSNQLARISARDFGSLNRISISQAPSHQGNANLQTGLSLASVAMSGIDPREFARPFSRHDIFLQGSIRNLPEFENEGLMFELMRIITFLLIKFLRKQLPSLPRIATLSSDCSSFNKCRCHSEFWPI